MSLYSRYSSEFSSSSSSDSFDLERFLHSHARDLESIQLQSNTKLDVAVAFTEPTGLRDLLIPFSREFIRYSPHNYFEFSSQYWTAKAENEENLQQFLLHLAHQYEPQWKSFAELQREEQKKHEFIKGMNNNKTKQNGIQEQYK